MKTVNDYESLAVVGERILHDSEPPELLSETLAGSQVVGWYSQIEDFLQKQLDNQEAARNHENADRLRAFLNTWRENELTGSISVDQLRPLKAAAEQGAAVKSGLRTIFTSILRNLRKLIADEEQLPRGVDTDQLNPMAGGLGRGAPPMSPDFGPEEQPPPGMEGELGQPGEEGAGMEPGPGEDLGAEKVTTAAETEPLGKRARK